MGALFAKLFSSLFGGKEVRILILGLDNAGKTTILCALAGGGPRRRAALCRPAVCADRLQVDEPITTVPTIGFNVETLNYKNVKFQVWDLGGQTSIRPYWRCYYPNTDAIVFVVDSADTDRLKIAKQELVAMLEARALPEPRLRSSAVLPAPREPSLTWTRPLPRTAHRAPRWPTRSPALRAAGRGPQGLDFARFRQ